MIKNIIFDIGDVLVGYNPEKYVKEIGMEIAKVNKANDILIKSMEWRQYLNGNIEVNKILQYFIEKYPNLEEEFRILLLKQNNKQIIYEIKENTELLKELSNKYNIYLLSNITKETFEYIQETFDFVNYIKGGKYSYIEHISKPDKRIYQELVKQYKLNPNETIYIDDKKKNVDISKEMGMVGIQLKEGMSLKKEIGE